MSHYLAYLDAGSGSLIIQAIVAGAAGVAVFFKLGWSRITGAFRKRPSTVETSGAKAEETPAAAGADRN